MSYFSLHLSNKSRQGFNSNRNSVLVNFLDRPFRLHISWDGPEFQICANKLNTQNLYLIMIQSRYQIEKFLYWHPVSANSHDLDLFFCLIENLEQVR